MSQRARTPVPACAHARTRARITRGRDSTQSACYQALSPHAGMHPATRARYGRGTRAWSEGRRGRARICLFSGLASALIAVANVTDKPAGLVYSSIHGAAVGT